MAADHPHREPRDEEFKHQPRPPRNALVAALLHLIQIIHEANRAKANHHKQAGPDVIIAHIHPQYHRNADCSQDHQPAHCWRANLGKMSLRAIIADRLPLALANAQPADEFGAYQQPDQQRCRHRRARAERQIAHKIERVGEIEILGNKI